MELLRSRSRVTSVSRTDSCGSSRCDISCSASAPFVTATVKAMREQHRRGAARRVQLSRRTRRISQLRWEKLNEGNWTCSRDLEGVSPPIIQASLAEEASFMRSKTSSSSLELVQLPFFNSSYLKTNWVIENHN